MTNDKHTKRAARELAANENISYTAARRRLAEDATPDASSEILRQHTVLCVGAACQAATDRGAPPDQVRNAAAQLLAEQQLRRCKCGSYADTEDRPWVSYRVAVEFEEPLTIEDTASIIDFAWQLFDGLGIYAGLGTWWEPAQIDGTGITYLDAENLIVNVTMPVLNEYTPPDPMFLGHHGAEEAVYRALSQSLHKALDDVDTDAVPVNATPVKPRALPQPADEAGPLVP